MKNDRRNILKTLTLGGGALTVAKLPSSWTKPVIESVVLPAHAATTPAGPCVIRVNFLLELTGLYEGSGGFELYDLSTCYFDDGSEGPFDESFSFPQLGPGTYYFIGGAGGNGSEGGGTMRLEVSCCDQSAVVTDSGSGGESFGDEMALGITLFEDGTCSIQTNVALPVGPCDT